MNSNIIKTAALSALMLIPSFKAHADKRGFAIVIDPKSYQEAKTEVDAYAKAIEDVNGLKVYILQDRWGVPDSIREHLRGMHLQKTSPIEGAALVGDIPVAMIRDAQHLTSAFKMNQKYPRKDSSVPSDRYYDDFGMKFNYIDRDSDVQYFYYSLAAESRQTLRPDIYTGRIRPTDCGGTSRYEKLRSYLRKVVSEKRHSRKLSQMLYFSGHGYISESVTARIDEKHGLYEHFPWLLQQHNGIGFISHDQQDVTKYLLMNELQRPDLDYAILHHHGAPDTQYMDGTPQINMPDQAKKFIQEYCRAYIHHAVDVRKKDKDSIARVLEKRFDIPYSWFSDAYDAEVMKKDSINDADEDLTIGDFYAHGYKPNCRVVMIDACFTGSYHLDDCIANEYIFNPGHTVTVIANSVNVLQDKWSDRYMGLIGLGACIGQLSRFSGYLESQCIGDPTYTFTPAAPSADINALLASTNYKAWNKYLKDYTYPDLTCMAIEQLHRAGKISSAELLRIFKNSKSALVRVQALTSLSELRGDDFIEAIKLGVSDSYELVQRFSLNFLGKSGDPRLIPTLIKSAITNNTSRRCNFSMLNDLAMFQEDKLMAEFRKQFYTDSVCYIDKDKVGEQITHAIHNNADKWIESIDGACNDTLNTKSRMRYVRDTRNYTPPYEIGRLIQAVKTTKDPAIQTALLESLGWRNYSYEAERIAEFAKAVSTDSSYQPAVRNEALKTYNRVKAFEAQ